MKTALYTTTRRRRQGFTLLEMLLGTSVLILLAGMLLQSLLGLRTATASGGASARVQDRAQRAMDTIVDDLRSSGFVDQPGGLPDYPYIFFDGIVSPLFAAHAHPMATKAADQNDYDFGGNREIVFRLPADNDGDGAPDIDANGFLVWEANEYSYVVVTDAQGVNQLQRRVNGGNPQTIASNVERIVFDTQLTSGLVVPRESISVQLFFREPDEDGNVHRHSLQAIVRLRNGVGLN